MYDQHICVCVLQEYLKQKSNEGRLALAREYNRAIQVCLSWAHTLINWAANGSVGMFGAHASLEKV